MIQYYQSGFSCSNSVVSNVFAIIEELGAKSPQNAVIFAPHQARQNDKFYNLACKNHFRKKFKSPLLFFCLLCLY